MRAVFQRDSFVSAPPLAVFELHERPGAFGLLTPPDFGVEVIHAASTLEPSEEVVRFDARVAGARLGFAMVHTVYRKPELFVDEQLRGPFSTWRHDHRMLRGGFRDDPATRLSDRLEYSHPLLPLANPVVRRRLARLFAFRHEVTRRELAGLARAGPRPGRVAVTGATGLIGARLVEVLVEKGTQVTALVRDPCRARALLGDEVELVRWDLRDRADGDWARHLAGVEAVVHLAGAPVLGRRWNEAWKREIEESRVLSTRRIVEALSSSSARPEVLVTASAIGFYGRDPRPLVDEEAPAADDLLARVCEAWEREARAVEAAGVRSVQVRIGEVLSRRSGALRELLPLFRAGLGGVLGAPDRWVSWVHNEDVVRILLMALLDRDLRGPVNAVAPHPVTNRTLAHTLARVLRRPCLGRYPEWLVRLVAGEAGAYSAGGPRVLADKVVGRGYEFFFDDLEPALRVELDRPA